MKHFCLWLFQAAVSYDHIKFVLHCEESFYHQDGSEKIHALSAKMLLFISWIGNKKTCCGVGWKHSLQCKQWQQKKYGNFESKVLQTALGLSACSRKGFPTTLSCGQYWPTHQASEETSRLDLARATKELLAAGSRESKAVSHSDPFFMKTSHAYITASLQFSHWT